MADDAELKSRVIEQMDINIDVGKELVHFVESGKSGIQLVNPTAFAMSWDQYLAVGAQVTNLLIQKRQAMKQGMLPGIHVPPMNGRKN